MNNETKITYISKTDKEIFLDIEFLKDNKFFNGHFEEFKLLPALVQVHTVVEICKENFSLSPDNIYSLSTMKFQNPITPLKQIKLKVKLEKQKIEFEFSSNDKIHSKGALKYEK